MGWVKTEKTNTLAKLGDINFSTSPVDGNALVYDGTNQVWKPGQGGGGGSSTLSELTDTDINSLANGQFLQYNANKSKWVNSTANVPFEYFMYATLTAGQTSLSFTSPLIGANTLIDMYIKDSNGAALLDVLPTAASVSGTTITFTFEAQPSNINVAIKLSGEPGIVYDYSLSNITLTKDSHYIVEDIPEFSTNESWELVFDYDFTGDPSTYTNGRFAFFTLGHPEVIGALYGFYQGVSVWGRIQYNNTYTSFFTEVPTSTLVGKHIFKYRFENHILYLYLDDHLVNSYNITSDTTFNNILIGSGSTTEQFFTPNGFDGKVNFLGFRWLS